VARSFYLLWSLKSVTENDLAGVSSVMVDVKFFTTDLELKLSRNSDSFSQGTGLYPQPN
jgi:hypothetical protein